MLKCHLGGAPRFGHQVEADEKRTPHTTLVAPNQDIIAIVEFTVNPYDGSFRLNKDMGHMTTTKYCRTVDVADDLIEIEAFQCRASWSKTVDEDISW